jgi:fucose permease
MTGGTASTTFSKRALIALNCFAMGQHGLILLMVGAVLPEMMGSLGIEESGAGIMLAFGSLGFTMGPMIAGAIADRSSVKKSLALGLAIEVVLLCLYGFVPALIFAILANFLLRFGAAFVETSVNIIPTVIEKRRGGSSKGVGSLMNLIHFFFSIGALVSPLLAGFVLKAAGSWRPVFWLGSAVTLVFVLFVLRVRFPASGFRSVGRPRIKPAEILDRSLVFGALTILLYVGAEVVASSWIVYYLKKGLGFHTIAATSGLSVLWIGIMAGRILFSILARYRSSRELVVSAGLLGLVAGLILLTARSVVFVYLWIGMLGFAMSGIFPTVMAEINSRRPEKAGTVTGIMTVAAAAGAVLFQPVVGVVAETYGISTAIVIPGILMGCVAVSFWGVSDPESVEEEVKP